MRINMFGSMICIIVISLFGSLFNETRATNDLSIHAHNKPYSEPNSKLSKTQFPDLYYWRGQGANPQYNPLSIHYNIEGIPLPLSQDAGITSPTKIHHVTNPDEFLTILKLIKPGEAIEFKPGIYKFTKNIKLTTMAHADSPIIVYAEELGNTLIEFDAIEGFNLNAPYWVFQNLVIKGVCKKHSKCEHAFHITGKGDYVIIRNSILVDFNSAIKANSSKSRSKNTEQSQLSQNNIALDSPDHVLIEHNNFVFSQARNTSKPVTTLDVVTGNGWYVKGNLFSDFIKLKGDHISYAAFLKGGSVKGVFEQNLVICSMRLNNPHSIQVGLSLGGGGTGSKICPGGRCEYEHSGGTIKNNIIMNCKDVGIYINKGKDTLILNNTLFNNLGIDVRFKESNAIVENNILTGRIKARNNARIEKKINIEYFNDQWFESPKQGNFFIKTKFSDQLPLGTKSVDIDFCNTSRNDTETTLGAVSMTSSQNKACRDLLEKNLPSIDLKFNQKHYLEKQDFQNKISLIKREKYLKKSTRVCGAGCEYKNLNKALKAVKTDGTVYIAAENINTCGSIFRSVKLIGEISKDGKKPHLSGAQCRGKAAIVVKAPEVTIKNIEISKVNVKDGNGACIRIQNGSKQITVSNVYCHDSQTGILAFLKEGELLIENSVFEKNGFNNGRSSNLSLNSEGRIHIKNCKIISTQNKGHSLSINAPHMLIENSVIAALNGENSRAIDNRVGGNLTIRNSIIQQGPHSESDEMLGFALGPQYELLMEQSILLENNWFIFDKQNKGILFRANNTGPTLIKDNKIVGIPEVNLDNIEMLGNNVFNNRKEIGLPSYNGQISSLPIKQYSD